MESRNAYKRLDAGICCHSWFFSITLELAPNDG